MLLHDAGQAARERAAIITRKVNLASVAARHGQSKIHQLFSTDIIHQLFSTDIITNLYGSWSVHSRAPGMKGDGGGERGGDG